MQQVNKITNKIIYNDFTDYLKSKLNNNHLDFPMLYKTYKYNNTLCVYLLRKNFLLICSYGNVVAEFKNRCFYVPGTTVVVDVRYGLKYNGNLTVKDMKEIMKHEII